jgi:hypothetical protein
MSAVRATATVYPDPHALAADVQAMQDVLYDILATGIDPEQNDVPSAEIERFLHEHARSPKSLLEFRAFFAQQGLSVRARPMHQPAALALPPIERAEATAVAALPVDPDAGRADPEPRTTSHALAAPAPRGRLGLMLKWAAFVGVSAALGFAGFCGYTTIAELRAALDRSSFAHQQDREAIQALRDHAAILESSVTTTGELVQRMDQKNELVLQSLLTLDHGTAGKRHR